MFLSMESNPDKRLERLAYNIKLAYKLLSRVEAGESIKAMASGMGFGHSRSSSIRAHAEKVRQLQDNFTEKHVIGEPKYKDAVSTLETKFGNVPSVRDILDEVYRKCPTLKQEH